MIILDKYINENYIESSYIENNHLIIKMNSGDIHKFERVELEKFIRLEKAHQYISEERLIQIGIDGSLIRRARTTT